MSGFDLLGRELESAAAARRSARWSRRAAGAGGAVAVALVLATVAVVAVGAVVLLHGRRASTPTAASAQPAPAAQAAAWARALTCPGTLPLLGKQPAITDAAPDPRLLAALGVLRGSWTAADAVPAGTTCKTTSPPLPEVSINVRYVRYIGLGLRGGEVFLVPGTLNAPRLPVHMNSPALKKAVARLSHEPVACLITVGGSSPLTQGCSVLPMIEHPLGVAFALPAPGTSVAPLRIGAPSRAVIRQVCSHVPVDPGTAATAKSRAAARAACLRSLLPPHVLRPKAPAQPELISGVVRDGIATVDVYALVGKAEKLVLSGVPVHDNVYSFKSGGAVAGALKLVFKDSNGHVVPTAPVQTGVGVVNTIARLVRVHPSISPAKTQTVTSNSVVGTSRPVPAPVPNLPITPGTTPFAVPAPRSSSG
jgi:hypothetical protein